MIKILPDGTLSHSNDVECPSCKKNNMQIHALICSTCDSCWFSKRMQHEIKTCIRHRIDGYKD